MPISRLAFRSTVLQRTLNKDSPSGGKRVFALNHWFYQLSCQACVERVKAQSADLKVNTGIQFLWAEHIQSNIRQNIVDYRGTGMQFTPISVQSFCPFYDQDIKLLFVLWSVYRAFVVLLSVYRAFVRTIISI